jgi:hypothetical protein
MKHDCVSAVIHSKTYFGMEKDACVPSKPMNGVCMGVIYSYKGKEYTGYLQVDHDKFKIGDSVDICIEKANPDMLTAEKKNDILKLVYWLLLVILLAVLSSIKLSLWSVRPKYFNRLFIANVVVGVIFVVMVAVLKKDT